MNDPSLAAQADAWHGALLRTTAACTTYYARRVPHWIAISSRICGALECSPLVGHNLAGELLYAARREIDLRAEYTRLALGELAEQNTDVPAPLVLVGCTRLAAELVHASVRDVVADIESASRFLHGVDAGCVTGATSQALRRITDHLLATVAERSDSRP